MTAPPEPNEADRRAAADWLCAHHGFDRSGQAWVDWVARGGDQHRYAIDFRAVRLAQAFAAHRLAERERCAKVLEREAVQYSDHVRNSDEACPVIPQSMLATWTEIAVQLRRIAASLRTGPEER